MKQDLDNLPRLDLKELRAAWTARFREPAPTFRTRELIARALAYRLQIRTHGGPSLALKRRLEELANTYLADAEFEPAPKAQLLPGTRLTRDWNGAIHIVDVTPAGLLYRGNLYRSLSQLARQITGARWSGPRFFGLTGAAHD